MAEVALFLDVFPCCRSCAGMCGGLEKASLSAVVVEREERGLFARAFFAQMPAPAELNIIENTIAAEYGLKSVEISADYPRPKAPEKKEKKAKDSGDVLMGKAIRGAGGHGYP